jgi:hypothetical protein
MIDLTTMPSVPDVVATDEASDERRGERGVSIVLGSLVLLVLIGMAGFAVDLGWLFLQQTNARKTAEAAALAGVVHMPQPSDVAFIGGEAYTVARDVAVASGHTSNPGVTAVTPSEVPGHPHQLRVDVSDTIDTFFMRVFGINEVQVNAAAVAEQLPPLRLGSDENHLGPGNNAADDEAFWVAVNGDYTNKGQGDAYTSECLGDFDTPCQGANPDYVAGRPSYWYAVEVPSTEVGKSLTVQIFDPQTSPQTGPTNDRTLNNAQVSANPHSSSRTRFRLLEPDATTNDPTDNSVQVCSTTYRHHSDGSYNPADQDTWVNFCTTSAKRGIYVFEVRQTGNVDLLNGFSIRALVDGSNSNDIAIYGIGTMSLWFPNPGTTADFKVVYLDEIYSGQQLIISLWDAGDLDDPGNLEFTGALAGIDCDVQERNGAGVVTDAWHGDDGDLISGGVGCHLDIGIREHNNEWLDFRFDVPPSYTCSGSACWSFVEYNFPGVPHDRTTWSATINGQPIHLIE